MPWQMGESGGLECGIRQKRAWRQSGPGSDATPFVAARHRQSRPTPPITVCRTTILPRLHIVIFVSVFLLAFIPVSVEGLASSQRCVTRTPGRSRRMTTCLSHHVVVTQNTQPTPSPQTTRLCVLGCLDSRWICMCIYRGTGCKELRASSYREACC
jgi:hypothetical protein